jgi:outer membrane protein with beta-barrel domain
MRGHIAIAASLALVTPSSVAAQSAPRVYISVNGGIQTSDSTISQAVTVQKNFEPAQISADIDEKSGVAFDAGVVFRLAGHFGVGVAGTFVNHEDNGVEVEGSIPHPFFFDRPNDPATVPGPRAIQGTANAKRQETGVHIEAAWLVPGNRLDLMFFGGPTFFRAEQGLVTDVTYSESYPFDTATFTGATTVDSTSDWATGFNVGADVAWKFSRTFGVGAIARYSRAEAEFNAANNAAIKADVGGFIIAGGVRIAF